MRYIIDHDYHIHSTVSLCCHDKNQTPAAILQYAKENGLKQICLTNHFWDQDVKSEAHWNEAHGYKQLSSVLPLPQDNNIKFLFGAETDMDYNNVWGISAEKISTLDFVVVATTHLHLVENTVKTAIKSPQEAANLWISKIEALLNKKLPRHKIGIAHLTCNHIFKDKTIEVLKLLDNQKLYSVFSDCAAKDIGIELNIKTLSLNEETRNIILRPYCIAKDCGCKFYLGSDAHKTEALKTAKDNFENIVTLLDLKESDKFIIC